MPIRSKGEFWNTIIGDSKNYADELYKVLSARGFLLDYHDGVIKVLYNNHKDDFSYLDEILKKINVGRVVLNEIAVNYKCANFISTEEPYLVDEGIIDIKNEVDINNVIDRILITDQIGFECAFGCEYPWWHFLGNVYGEKVPVRYLETYVARFCKGLSACGLTTSRSCDGNHEKLGNSVWLDFYASPNDLFYDAICKYVLNKRFDFDYGYNMPIKEENQYDVYYKLNIAGEFLFKNKNFFLKTKAGFYTKYEPEFIKDNENRGELKTSFNEYLKIAFSNF